MQQFSSYDQYFYKLAYENYIDTKEICKMIEKAGYYKEPEKLLKKTIYETLDLYIEAVLGDFCIACSRLDAISTRFIESLLATTQMIPMSGKVKLTSKQENSINRIVNAPPVLLQLCGLYDFEEAKEISPLFFDRMLSILLALVNINGGKNKEALYYVQQYYERMIPYINADERNSKLSKRYLFRKISSDNLIKIEEMDIRRDIENKANEITHETTNITKNEPAQDDITIIDDDFKLNQYVEELNGLIGLKEVKGQIASLINVIKVRKLRERYDMPLAKMSYHMVFWGNPGTGKTTVARMVADIYRELGIVEKGTFVETDRSGLVAGYVGQTAIKVTEVVKRALGGVLFIDEAYSLTNGRSANDFGSEAIDTLVKLMEDHRQDLVVIVAGYKKEMQKFLKSNPGLISRFNMFMEFEDNSCDELIEILKLFAEKNEMKFSKQALEQVKTHLLAMDDQHRKEFGNARGIRNMFERILINQANRLVSLNTVTKEEIATVEVEDVIEVPINESIRL